MNDYMLGIASGFILVFIYDEINSYFRVRKFKKEYAEQLKNIQKIIEGR